MKKTVMLTTAILLALSLMGCGFGNKNDDKNNDKSTPVEDNANDQNVVETDEGAMNDNQDDDLNHNGENQLDLADDAADKVNELDEVETATVIVTDRTAYVAVVMNNEGGDDDATTDTNADEEISKELEEKIADKVREADTNIENVYVSLNPDFVERMTDYGNRINEGEPIEGFFEEFGEAVRNVFPDAN